MKLSILLTLAALASNSPTVVADELSQAAQKAEGAAQETNAAITRENLEKMQARFVSARPPSEADLKLGAAWDCETVKLAKTEIGTDRFTVAYTPLSRTPGKVFSANTVYRPINGQPAACISFKPMDKDWCHKSTPPRVQRSDQYSDGHSDGFVLTPEGMVMLGDEFLVLTKVTGDGRLIVETSAHGPYAKLEGYDSLPILEWEPGGRLEEFKPLFVLSYELCQPHIQ